MNRASPSELRKSLVAANALAQAGILFVALPVLNEADHAELINNVAGRLEAMALQAEKDEQL